MGRAGLLDRLLTGTEFADRVRNDESWGGVVVDEELPCWLVGRLVVERRQTIGTTDAALPTNFTISDGSEVMMVE